MISKIVIILSMLSLYSTSKIGCYWNNHCAYQYFGAITPYDTVRGDLRDWKKVDGCEAVSFWSLHRHGNRNPSKDVTANMKAVAGLKDQIVAAYDAGRSLLCAQDIDAFRKWSWNVTVESSEAFLTGFGYEEQYDVGSRVREVYPELLDGSPSDYYFRPTEEERTAQSAVAFVHGLSDVTNLTLTIDDSREIDNVIRPYKNCDRYQVVDKNNTLLDIETTALETSAEYQAMKNAIQTRLGISHQISTAEVSAFYDLCRFYRTWDPRFQSPWCAVFSDEELKLPEYKEDLKHYYKSGYEYWFNERLGELPLRDLYEQFEAAIQGQGRKMTSYFTHDTMLQMVWSALGLYKDPTPLRGAHRQENRRWRNTFQSPLAMNLMAVLNRCQESNTQTYRVQIFIGEKVTELCPLEGCTWAQFQNKFQHFSKASLDFCSLNYSENKDTEQL